MDSANILPERLVAVRRLRLALLIFIHVMIIVSGTYAATENARSGVSYLVGIVLACAAVLACVDDARVRGRPILPIVQFLMLFVWPLSVILYLIGSRGWRGILWALLWTVTGLVCLIAGAFGAKIVQAFAGS